MIVVIILLSVLFLEATGEGGRAASERSGITSQEKNKGLLESLTKCKKKEFGRISSRIDLTLGQ